MVKNQFRPFPQNLIKTQIIETSQSNTDNLSIKPLSLDSIFSKEHIIGNSLDKNRIRTIIVTGDIIPARSVNYITINKNDFTWPYLKTADFLKDADLTFVNLETPLLHNCKPTTEGMIFCGDSQNVEGLVFAGIDIVNLANNHAGNYEKEGVAETTALLEKNNISVTGIDKPLIKNIRGIKFAFLGYDDITKPQPGINNATEEKIKQDIIEAKSESDVVIITFHWGVEYRDQPDDRQIYLGHFAIDNGADLVIGNHPHWIQPVELYKGKLITYAHGNFIFDQEWSLKTTLGVVGKYTFYDKKLIDVEYFPIEILNYGQPYFLQGERKQWIIDDMRRQSELLATGSASL